MVTDPMLQNRMITRPVFDVLDGALKDARTYGNPYLTPEHILFQMETERSMQAVLKKNSLGSSFFRDRLGLFISSLPSARPDPGYAVQLSDSIKAALEDASVAAGDDDGAAIDIPHLLFGIAGQRESLAGYLLRKNPGVLMDFGVILFDADRAWTGQRYC